MTSCVFSPVSSWEHYNDTSQAADVSGSPYMLTAAGRDPNILDEGVGF